MRVVRVLLVDDEARFVDTLGKRLTARGYYVQVAYSGEQALEMLRGTPFDVVLLDVRMPGIDGLETLREMARFQPLVKVLLLSGNASINVAIEGMRHGAVDFLLKPTDLEEVLAKIDAAFEKKRLEEEQAAGGRMKSGE
jgi:DNA-binding NtrC family response regulator